MFVGVLYKVKTGELQYAEGNITITGVSACPLTCCRNRGMMHVWKRKSLEGTKRKKVKVSHTGKGNAQTTHMPTTWDSSRCVLYATSCALLNQSFICISFGVLSFDHGADKYFTVVPSFLKLLCLPCTKSTSSLILSILLTPLMFPYVFKPTIGQRLTMWPYASIPTVAILDS